MLVHVTAVGGDVSLSGGGGGVSCTNPPPAITFTMSPGPYRDFEDVTIGGSLSINGWHFCWLGFFRATIAHDVFFHGNMTADPDGNEIATNTILGNISCDGNTPAPQIGDSGGTLNTVLGSPQGQCNNPALVVH